MLCEKSFLKIFAKFTRKHLYWSLFLIKLQVKVCNFIKETLAWLFPVNFVKFFGTTIFHNIGERLLLNALWTYVWHWNFHKLSANSFFRLRKEKPEFQRFRGIYSSINLFKLHNSNPWILSIMTALLFLFVIIVNFAETRHVKKDLLVVN